MTIIILIWLRSMMLALDCLFFFGLLVVINGGVPSLVAADILENQLLGALGYAMGAAESSVGRRGTMSTGKSVFGIVGLLY
ncbi:hypothetical protein [Fructobacillus tropaeoli]|uniref:hypothetical protein n=1 Tax=Fructobacillus tropaeoli TaxID=709323 RepID=UPI0019447400|nr:hypothetical protein [Fructobacillus tropaeoli]GIC69659.1 hypothetical protein FT12353_02970 [Fructobacillus tropaeoli]